MENIKEIEKMIFELYKRPLHTQIAVFITGLAMAVWSSIMIIGFLEYSFSFDLAFLFYILGFVIGITCVFLVLNDLILGNVPASLETKDASLQIKYKNNYIAEIIYSRITNAWIQKMPRSSVCGVVLLLDNKKSIILHVDDEKVGQEIIDDIRRFEARIGIGLHGRNTLIK